MSRGWIFLATRALRSSISGDLTPVITLAFYLPYRGEVDTSEALEVIFAPPVAASLAALVLRGWVLAGSLHSLAPLDLLIASIIPLSSSLGIAGLFGPTVAEKAFEAAIAVYVPGSDSLLISVNRLSSMLGLHYSRGSF